LLISEVVNLLLSFPKHSAAKILPRKAWKAMMLSYGWPVSFGTLGVAQTIGGAPQETWMSMNSAHLGADCLTGGMGM
jgi:hypothetical protein